MNQRNVPGIDNAYLAMDTEEGVEVVWNEVMFSERKNFKLQEVGARGGVGGGVQMAVQAGLNETCITTCQRINSLNSSLSVLGLSSLDWPQPAEQFQRKASGICWEKRWIGRV